MVQSTKTALSLHTCARPPQASSDCKWGSWTQRYCQSADVAALDPMHSVYELIHVFQKSHAKISISFSNNCAAFMIAAYALCSYMQPMQRLFTPNASHCMDAVTCHMTIWVSIVSEYADNAEQCLVDCGMRCHELCLNNFKLAQLQVTCNRYTWLRHHNLYTPLSGGICWLTAIRVTGIVKGTSSA